MGAIGCVSALNPSIVWAAQSSQTKRNIAERVNQTLLVDTHEHLMEEEDRLSGNHPRIRANDWSILLGHYINSDLLTAGMPDDDLNKVLSSDLDPIQKWKMVEPYWPSVRTTGYGQAVEITIQELYGISKLSGDTIEQVQTAYEETIKPGYYKTVLRDTCQIESCQVNYLQSPFSETKQPLLLMQDISILGMHIGPNIDAYAPRSGIEVKGLSDWLRVIDWWFDNYGPYAVAVKSQAAYGRALNYARVKAEEVEPIFKKRLENEPITMDEKKIMEDFLFWYAVNKATDYQLPVKIHTGYYAGHNHMPLSRVQSNPGDVTDLCRMAPETDWVFMHIGYPYYEPMIAAAKHYTNCHIDMCWGWILSPVASVNFLKQYLVTAPINKVFTFGGDYIFVEPVIGHAKLARIGIIQALTELVDDGWLTLNDAIDLVEPIMRGNARKTFRLEAKEKVLADAPWM